MPAARTVSRSDVVSFRVNAGGSTATSTAVQGVTEGCDERLMQARQVRQADDGRDEEWRRAWQEKRQKVAASGRRATHWGWEGTALGRNVTTAINTGTNLWYVKVHEGGTTVGIEEPRLRRSRRRAWVRNLDTRVDEVRQMQ